MGKCSICGKRIEYNAYKIIDETVYCLNCASKKLAGFSPPLKLTKTITGNNEPVSGELQKEIAETLAKTVKDSKVKFDEFEKAMDEVSEKLVDDTPKQERKPMKRRVKK